MKLMVEEVAIEMIRELRPLIIAIDRHDKQLGRQLKASASSVALNIAEGTNSRSGHALERFGTASGSNSETRANLRVASAWGYISEEQRLPVDAKLDRIGAMLWGLLHRRK